MQRRAQASLPWPVKVVIVVIACPPPSSFHSPEQKVVTPAGIVTGTIRTMEAHTDAPQVTKEGANILATLARSDTYRRYVVHSG